MPTAVVGKPSAGQTFEDHPNYAAIKPLLDAKAVKTAVAAGRAAKKAPKASAKSSDAGQRAQAMAQAIAARATSVPTEAERKAAIDATKREAEVATVTATGRPASKKQLFGALVHQAALALLDGELPEGLTRDEAEASLTRWLQHVPSPSNPGGRAPRPSDKKKGA